jgi:DNA-binding NtrC family response regulator
VGGEKALRVDVRIIAATNQDLRQLLAIGEFRRDLYFRLNVLHIALPALRERREDITLLVEAFVRDASERHDRRFAGISPEAMEILRDYAWPGNVRELRNLVESMVVLAPGGTIGPNDIPAEVRSGRGRSLLPATIPRVGPTARAQGRDLRPELEFVFRTLVDLRVDMDDLRREFEAYRRETALVVPDRAWARPAAWEVPARAVELPGPGLDLDEEQDGASGRGGAGHASENAYGAVQAEAAGEGGQTGETGQEAPRPANDGSVVFRPGMTMDELEREAIRSALQAVGGNRRRAAEMLDIGERTLYRKISKYGLDG